MGLVISLLNHKGGVGKTTSAINIGAGLAELGKNVLLIDLDPQANLTLSLGVPRQPNSIYEALRGESPLVPYPAKERLAIVTSNLDLSGAEMELINEAGREFILECSTVLFLPIPTSVSLVILPFSLVFLAVRPNKLPVSFLLAIHKIAVVAVAVDVRDSTRTMQ